MSFIEGVHAHICSKRDDESYDSFIILSVILMSFVCALIHWQIASFCTIIFYHHEELNELYIIQISRKL